MLPAGEFALVVKDLAAFQARYGNSHDAQIKGAYDPDSLSNGGEPIRLSYGQGEPIQEFTYDDVAPWPSTSDGSGPTLTLINPNLLPDHTIPGNWRASAASLGTPGADEPTGGLTFGQWAAGFPGVTDPNGDNDGDGVSNRLEYAFNGHPLQPSAGILPTGGIQSLGGPPANYLVVTFTRRVGITDLTFIVEFSTDLAVWTGGAVLVDSITNPDGSITDRYRSPTPVTSNGRWFAHVRAQ